MGGEEGHPKNMENMQNLVSERERERVSTHEREREAEIKIITRGRFQRYCRFERGGWDHELSDSASLDCAKLLCDDRS